ncbi:TPA: adenosylmethionine--8-amino-7-oxononanoate transaminase [Candidatus Gastranaerophilales bacterium HUM_20]|nr:adenosylmethionine-8-amino-7-oxononanoate aminotransferase [Clostridium sp. CAG:729]DAB21808.1 MAG TPA: adenosylmethionine--8-amino-7-oxononanoate transaminase [Candidatus Gastranaerophilales bacterium HUM_20]
MDNWAEKDLKYIWHPCSQMKDYETLPPIVIEKGKGVYLYDTEGKRYVDVISSWWCNLLGHCNPHISEEIKKQADELEHVIFANFTHKQAIRLCERLSKILPEGLCKFNFTDNGSSAIEAAMKVSFQYHEQSGNPQKVKFMALSEAYHGETIGALSVGDCDLYTRLYKPILMDIVRVQGPDCFRCQYGKNRDNCACECAEKAAQTFAKYGDETAALLVEPLLQGSAGMKVYPPLYLKKLRELCDKYNVHLIADEIATGYGRTGKMFAFEHAGVSPDIMCLSKGLTGGYMPMALFVTTQKIYDAFYDDYGTGKAFMHSHTYSGNPLACSAANAVLDIMEDGSVLKRAQENAVYFNNMINEKFLSHPNVGEVRHIGLVNAIELVEDKQSKKPFDSRLRTGYQIYKKALMEGVILRPLGDVIYFNPPLIMERKDMDYVTDIAVKCLNEILPQQNYALNK